MRYENPTVPEGINISRGHPLKRLLFLFAALFFLLVIVVFSLRLMVVWAAPYIPFAYEQRLVSHYFSQDERSESHARLLSYLQWLAQRLSKAANLPDDMTVTIHYRDDPTVNAVAMPGGHIVIYRGLLERLDSENALAMVMAHEIAHVKRRHPLINLGSGAVFSLVIAVVTGSTGDAVTGRVIGQLGRIADLGFSREQELQADFDALYAVHALYGHVSGADDLYSLLLQEAEDDLSSQVPEFMQTHPSLKKRLERLRGVIREWNWPDDRPVLMLPDFN